LYKKIKNPSSSSLKQHIENNNNLVESNVNSFVTEMHHIKIFADTRFVILGTENSIVGKHFINHFQKHFQNNPVVFYRHYASRGTDKDWVTGLWYKLGINTEFNEIIEKYH
jgi:hypothetical protein